MGSFGITLSPMSKHHYLSQFYLRGFTNGDGLFIIYLVKEQRFKQNGKLFSPASHFFLPDDNTIIKDGVKDDFLEENYSRMEGYVAKAIDKIKAVDENFGLDNLDVVRLQYFAAELFWRLPAHRHVIESVNNIESLHKLGVAVIDKKTLRPVNSAAFDAMVKDDPAYLKYLRTMLPVTTYWDLIDCTWPGLILTFPQEFPAICSDQPVILRHPGKLDVFRDDLILPLAHNKVMFRIKGMKRVFAAAIKFQIDMLVLMQAKEYVCCVDQDYVQLLVSEFHENYGTVEVLRKVIFEYLDAERHQDYEEPTVAS
jgi:hypothetical protein